MRFERALRVAATALAFAFGPPGAGIAAAGEHPMTLDEAIHRAVRENEDIVIGRESLSAAESGIRSASGAYDPLLEIQGGWQQTAVPVNSSISAAPPGESASTDRRTDASVVLRQLLPTGGKVSLHSAGDRLATDGTLALLSPAYETRAGLEVRQPLWRDLTVDAARKSRRVAHAERDGAAATLQRTASETVGEVEAAYWKLVAARLAVEVREEAVRLAEDQLAETRDRVESGAVPETEVAQPRAELERRKGELLETSEIASRAGNALKLLILDDDDPLWFDELAPMEDAPTEIVSPNLANSLKRALATRPEIAAAEADVQGRHAETAYANDVTRPTLDAVFVYERYGLAGSRNPALTGGGSSSGGLPSGRDGDLSRSFGMLGDGDLDDVHAGLVFAIPLGNRTARADARSAESRERQSLADLSRVRKMIRSEVLDAAAAVETAGQRIKTARAAREAAEVQFTAEHDRYDAGLSTNFLVLTRQNDLSRARLDEIAARTDYRIARVELARATGSLLGERGINPEEILP